MKLSSPLVKNAFVASLPALFGYVTLGMSFGFIFVKTIGFWYLAPLMSLLVYAGAAQFIAISLFAHEGTLAQIASATFIINLRHIFYGISFLGRFPDKFLKKIYMIFGITDESYSILTAIKAPTDHNFDFLVILFSHFYWVLGTLIGALIGKNTLVNLDFLKFTLVALFVVLTVEQYLSIKKLYPFVMAIVAIILGSIFKQADLLVISIFFVVCMQTLYYRKYIYE